MFLLVRAGWPNLVIVLALAAVPFVSLGLSPPSPDRSPAVHQVAHNASTDHPDSAVE
jgi:hypothetical protein